MFQPDKCPISGAMKLVLVFLLNTIQLVHVKLVEDVKNCLVLSFENYDSLLAYEIEQNANIITFICI